ncbi:MAG TPA: KH domain-containing protein [Fervidobacterium sp.]|nr:KH domain-containing protein [Fervidobacterium sp.]NLH38153.1 KH domain-containing protein [Thermotogaceae bacterium]MBP8657557.1 KH domain-containing protein [Fervidobacterium sp.]MBP9518501.1 KH domain-containing protein [Fervidobacterium sp.]HOA16951.1 KH domain-containing protein [Fervidobacterium sp.]
MKEFLEYVLKSIAKHPDDVVVVEYEEGGKKVFDISVHPEDVGQIIGKDGRTIKSIKILLSSISDDSDFILKVIR